jgi:redox-sensing transcriptional repressor
VPRPNRIGESRLSKAAASRLSLYLRAIEHAISNGQERISSQELGQALSIRDAQVRRDLACLGTLGHPGIGYNPEKLRKPIRRALGIDREWPTVLVGVGNLARALLRYAGFRQQGFHIRWLFDSDPAKAGTSLDGVPILPAEQMEKILSGSGAELGLIAVPASAAQETADRLIRAGVRGLLNFAPVVLQLPPHVRLVSVDLTIQLEQLTFLLTSGTIISD